MTKAPSAEDVKLMDSFESVRAILLSGAYADRLDKPLAYWVVPSDRRLPLAFLPRTLGELLAQSFNDLAVTAGIGKKKMSSLVMLLHRAVNTDPAQPFVAPPVEASADSTAVTLLEEDFNPATVSELVWAQWRETVRIHGIGQEKLGRLAPSLQDVPTVIWNTPLSFYLDKTLGEIRQLKTHGEKRVHVVLEVFHRVHVMLTRVDPALGLTIRLTPRFVGQIEDWIQEAKQRSFLPTRDELVERLIEPVLQQLEVDAGNTVTTIARARLGVGADGQSVRNQARKLGVTRARVYQLLEECHHVMDVRWPDGKRQLDELAQWLDEDYAAADCANLHGSLRELLYPLKFDAVAQHLVPQV
jgi:hypothetical protein